MASDLYHKIFPPYARHTTGEQRKQLDRSRWLTRELEVLAAVPGWTFTEKIDGANLAVIYNGLGVELRTRDGHNLETLADLDPSTIDALREIFHVTVMEQAFGSKETRIYLEVYGKGVGDHHWLARKLPQQRVAVLDARINGFWLARGNLTDLANDTFSLECAPHRADVQTLTRAIDVVTAGMPSALGDFTAEGLVGVAPLGLFNRKGERIIVKVKTEDLCTDPSRPTGNIDQLPLGLCADKADHAPHRVTTGSLAPFWCTADQKTREPYASEQRRKEMP